MKTFVISDTHFNHAKLMEYENRPENFNELIIKNWNKLVTPEDLVIHLGDVILGRNSELSGITGRLNGTKVLARGNHDNESVGWYMKRGFSFVADYFVFDNIAFSHAPLTPLPNQTLRQRSKEEVFVLKPVDLNIHGHFHRGKHRGQPGMPDRYYDHTYFDANRDKYKLVQIEDTFSPYLLEHLLKLTKQEK